MDKGNERIEALERRVAYLEERLLAFCKFGKPALEDMIEIIDQLKKTTKTTDPCETGHFWAATSCVYCNKQYNG